MLVCSTFLHTNGITNFVICRIALSPSPSDISIMPAIGKSFKSKISESRLRQPFTRVNSDLTKISLPLYNWRASGTKFRRTTLPLAQARTRLLFGRWGRKQETCQFSGSYTSPPLVITSPTAPSECSLQKWVRTIRIRSSEKQRTCNST